MIRYTTAVTMTLCYILGKILDTTAQHFDLQMQWDRNRQCTLSMAEVTNNCHTHDESWTIIGEHKFGLKYSNIDAKFILYLVPEISIDSKKIFII